MPRRHDTQQIEANSTRFIRTQGAGRFLR